MTPETNVDEGSFGFRAVQNTGAIYVSAEATKRGWSSEQDIWCNLGQGQPETGPLPGAPSRLTCSAFELSDYDYAPIPGLPELREAVAALYNRLFRRGLPSQYTAENVAIAGGGRTALTRTIAALGTLNLGHFLPDYTAYEEILELFRHVTPIPILLSAKCSYEFNNLDFRREIIGRGLGAVLLSNPSNPMGKLTSGHQLLKLIETGRDLECTLLLDEFYSHYIWRRPKEEPLPIVSGARWIEDVNKDPVVIFDGLTKNWRYPGWRVSWVLGPQNVIKSIGNAGSFLDGGASRPMQKSAIELLNPDDTLREARAIQKTFLPKRDLLIRKCQEIGLEIDREPDGTFYIFASLRKLSPHISDGMTFFRTALERNTIVVPGIFFDINPGQRRPPHHCRFGENIRLSFGPPIECIREGMNRLQEIIDFA